MFKMILLPFLLLVAVTSFAQDQQADNMLLFQRKSGGWSKQFNGKAFDYNVVFTPADKAAIAIAASKDDANIDNNSTTKEIRYLVKAYQVHKNQAYLTAAENGVRYLLKAQYKNGGFPQYYPDTSFYRSAITFNDNAMILSLEVLQDVALQTNGFESMASSLVKPAQDAVNRGIDCIVKTQIVVNGKRTGWCQQHDKITLKPTNARAYELASICGSETVGILSFLMKQPDPSVELKQAVHAGIDWLNLVKIEGYAVKELEAPGTEKGKDRRLVPEEGSVLWSRYYEIETNRPFFCDRDGIKKYSLAEIGYGRRNGYSWYGKWGVNLLTKTYPAWITKYPG